MVTADGSIGSKSKPSSAFFSSFYSLFFIFKIKNGKRSGYKK